MSHQRSSNSFNAHRRHMLIVFLTVGCVTLILFSARGQAAHQEQLKIFKQCDFDQRDPVRISGLEAVNRTRRAGTPAVLALKFDEAFSAGDDWLLGTKIQLKNVSDRDVIYVELRLGFPETLTSGNEMVFTANLGNMPGVPVVNPPLLLGPNQTVTFDIDDEVYKGLVKFVGYRQKISDINKVELKIGFVVFADMTAWGSGIRFKQNPQNPRSWIPIEDKD